MLLYYNDVEFGAVKRMHHKQQHKTAFAVLYEKRLQWIIATDVTINTFGFL